MPELARQETLARAGKVRLAIFPVMEAQGTLRAAIQNYL